MEPSRKFIVRKDAKTEVITYMEYENLKGFNVKPKHNINFEDMINVEEMIVINPGLIEKLVDKKCKRTFEKIITMISIASEEDDDDEGDASFMLILDEIERFKNLIINKYKNYIEEKEYETLLKKLEILKAEIERRRNYILEKELNYEVSKKGKSAR